ncbi:MAG: mechanosensitive ion channel family protein [Polyangiaceae bacterium]
MFRKLGESRRRTPIYFLGLHLVLWVTSSAALAGGWKNYPDFHLASVICGTIAGVTAASALVFRGGLSRVGIATPQILQDVVIATVTIVSALLVASRNGFNLSSIVATSAVLTAVIGLSLQDTLGNILGGLALQTDDSIRVGDWIKVGDLSGKVVEIRWRYAAIETRNWETVVVPNSVLLKNQVVILGRRSNQPVQWRRWVWFNVGYQTAPSRVLEVVERALRDTDIPKVASDPPPNVIVMDFADSWARYAVRYWLTDLAADDPTDSLVRQRVFFALKRAGISLAVPERSLLVTKENEKRRAESARELEEQHRKVLASVDLFRDLPEADRDRLADSLHFAPFAKGEVLTRQGAQAHWLYVVCEGECSVRVNVDGIEREVAKLGAGDFFGEMSLLTGASRSATVVATTYVECWRLDRTAFSELLKRRPEVADDVAKILAERQVELEMVKDQIGASARDTRVELRKRDLGAKIRAFFGLGDDVRPSEAPPS